MISGGAHYHGSVGCGMGVAVLTGTPVEALTAVDVIINGLGGTAVGGNGVAVMTGVAAESLTAVGVGVIGSSLFPVVGGTVTGIGVAVGIYSLPRMVSRSGTSAM